MRFNVPLLGQAASAQTVNQNQQRIAPSRIQFGGQLTRRRNCQVRYLRSLFFLFRNNPDGTRKARVPLKFQLISWINAAIVRL